MILSPHFLGRWTAQLLSGALFIAATSPALPMTVNLAVPYQPIPSPPRTEGIAFYSPNTDDFLFDVSHTDPRIICLPHKRALSLEWSLFHNTVKTPLAQGRVEPREDNSFVIPLPVKELAPGFYDLRVKIALTAETSIESITTFGWRVKEMTIHPSAPADFAAFWKNALKELDAIKPDPKWTLERTLRGPELGAYNLASAALPENYDPEGERFDAVEVYRVKFASVGGRTIEGWFTKPVGPGPFPALLVLPGAGNNARPAPVEHARHGYAALDIQVHGNSIDAPTYEPLPPDNATDPLQRIHYAVYLNALQGARVLPLLPGVDPKRLAVLGGSQGGRLSVVVAALDPAIKAAIPSITHYAYRPWAWWASRMNRTKSAGGTGFDGEKQTDGVNLSEEYFDVLNFAPMVHCPVLMTAGLIDPVSPPTGIYAVFRNLGGPKELVSLPNTGHDWAPAFDRRAWRWLDKLLQPPAPTP